MMFVAIGLCAGVLSGLFGIAGGIVIVPALVLLARFAPHAATGTSLAVFLLPVGVLAVHNYYKAGHVRVAPALFIALGVFAGAYFGAQMAQHVSPGTLRRGFALLLVVVAARMWFGAPR